MILNSRRSASFFPLSLIVLSFFVSSLHAQTKSDCLTCHSDQSLAAERNGKQVSLFADEKVLNGSVHGKLVCVACHAGFDMNNIPHKEKIEPLSCMTCHKDAPLKHKFHPQMAKANGRDGTPDISCKQCHGKHDVASPKAAGSKFHSSNIAQACGTCHAVEESHFTASAHGVAAANKISSAPTCVTCHSQVLTQKKGRDSVQVKISQERLCLSCHLDNPDVRARMTPSAGFIAAYEKSVHGSALLKGNSKVANCVNCHGSHEMKKGREPTSSVNRAHIAETCAQCHADVAKEYGTSVHGVAVSKGVKDTPVCTDCHGEHNILSHEDPRSPVAPLNVSGQVCAPCHGSVKLTEKFGIAGDRFQTFSDSYHGLAVKAGSVEVANCASCHGAHSIKRSADPASSVNRDRLAETCGKCHAGANVRFAVGAVHVAMTQEEDPLLYWIATLYVVLIVSVVGGMAVHNVADFIKKSRRKLMIRRGLAAEEHVGHTLYVRMTLSERLQHGSLLVSFTLLVITGFMLRYPDAWWVAGIRELSDQIFDLRTLIHRMAAVVMVAASMYHLYYLFFDKRGKELLRDLFPNLQDARDAIAVLKYNFGFSKNKPKFGRFSYIEKSEYWALVWGTIIMAATGFLMWFDNTFIGLLTKLGYDIARTVHFYEAWLATLAIVVWHFYFVIFNPDVYPINLAFWKGTLSEAEMHEEHPLELEQIKRKEGMTEVSEGEEKPRTSNPTRKKK